MSGTFDVQEVLVSDCPGGGGICVSIVYVEGTLSPGALVCAVRIMNNGVLDFANMKLVTIPRNLSDNFPIPVPSGEYQVNAFDLESNHLPRMPISMVALSLDKITVNSVGEGTLSVFFSSSIYNNTLLQEQPTYNPVVRALVQTSYRMEMLK